MVDHPNLILKIVKLTPTSVEFKCALEGSDYHIDDMPTYNFDLIPFGEVDNVPELIKRIGLSAMMIAEQQKAQEDFQKMPAAKLDLSKLMNREIRLTLQDIYSSDNFQVTQNG